MLVSARIEQGVSLSFTIAFLAGAIGVFAMITGAVMLARETTFSFRILREETAFITERVQKHAAHRIDATPAQKN